MKSVASRQNPWFKRVRDAVRDHANEIVIEGPKQVSDAMANGWSPIVVATRGETALPADGAARTARPEHICFTADIFDSLTETRTSQGVIALFERPRFTIDQLLSRRDTIVVALDGVQDPGNVGTIVRLAAAFDAAGVALLPGCADPFGPKAIRASVGAILNVPVVAVQASDLLHAGLPIFAAEQASGATPPPARGAILLFGSEGSGISPEFRGKATSVAIAMSSRVESLNVAAAAAILLARSYEARGR